MNNELLIKDLRSRLSCGVMFQYQTGSFNSTGTSDYFPMVGIVQNAVVLDIKNRGLFNLSLEDSQCKPYLRPMESMTEKEKEVYEYLCLTDEEYRQPFDSYHLVDWLNANHFDYRGLIPMGLALEAKEGMYNF